MEFNYIIIAEDAKFSEDKKISIFNAFDIIGASKFPATHKKLSVVANFKNFDSGEYIVQLKVKKNGVEIFSTPEQIEKKEGSTRHTIIHNIINLLFESEGNYDFEIYINNVFQGKEIIEVKKV